MAASVATIQPTPLKLASEDPDLEDVFITDLDQDLVPSPDKNSPMAETQGQGSEWVASRDMIASATASINAEWRSLKSSSSAVGEEEGGAASQPLPVPRRLSEADVILQPSQLEEMLGQNPLLLLNMSGAPPRDNGNPYLSTPQPQVLDRTNSVSSSTTTNSVQIEEQQPLQGMGTSPPATIQRRQGIWSDFVACIGPVVGMLKKDKRPSERRDEWEIPFADIRELNFIGSGSQGAVFVGEYLREKVAVKKVKDVGYCQEAKHLRKLKHPNIVKFR